MSVGLGAHSVPLVRGELNQQSPTAAGAPGSLSRDLNITIEHYDKCTLMHLVIVEALTRWNQERNDAHVIA
jgi:hypothetical protein